ncbi:MAG: HsdM family class I SAM-dependent methyltransferase, partial [Candidatus Woesearchaeota archaeon]
WSLKFPDTEKADDRTVLEKALEKAEAIECNSFVTWDTKNTYIYKIKEDKYDIDSLGDPIYSFDTIDEIETREDVEKYQDLLEKRTKEIVNKLIELESEGKIKRGISISETIHKHIIQSSGKLITMFEELLKNEIKGRKFSKEYQKWRSNEGLSTEDNPVLILAKRVVYGLLGRIIFASVLGQYKFQGLNQLDMKSIPIKNVQENLDDYFESVRKIDYQAVYKKDFTDKLEYNYSINEEIKIFCEVLNSFDLKNLYNKELGLVFENIVPYDERKKLGQYFTNTKLTNFILSFCIKDNTKITVLDPACGTGTFLCATYEWLKYYQNIDHIKILENIWGIDVAHFPAILSTINLYNKKFSERNNFPKVLRESFFNVKPGDNVDFPDPKTGKKKKYSIPKFDLIISNLPFVQNNIISKDLKNILKNKLTNVNGKSDLYVYFFYHIIKNNILKPNGTLAVIIPNTWLGSQNYAVSFKNFLLNNFHIEMVIESKTDPLFLSGVNVVLLILKYKKENNNNVKFIRLLTKLETLINWEAENVIESLRDKAYELENNLETDYVKNNFSIDLISKEVLRKDSGNWVKYFNYKDIFSDYEYLMTNVSDLAIIERGTKTGMDGFFVPTGDKSSKINNIDTKHKIKVIKTLKGNKRIFVDAPKILNEDQYVTSISCKEDLKTLEENFYNTYKYITKTKKITKSAQSHRPHWYSLDFLIGPKILIPVNPNEILYVAYLKQIEYLNQRVITITPKKCYNEVLFVALLNTILSIISLELLGTNMGQGALDLNKTSVKNNLKMIKLDKIDDDFKNKIISLFDKIGKREQKDYIEEMKMEDRFEFDCTVMKALGFSDVKNRVEILYAYMKELLVYRKEKSIRRKSK